MKHLSADQAKKLRSRDLTTSELFEIDDHLSQCEECRSKFVNQNQTEALRKKLMNDDIEDLDHLQFEQLASYVDQNLNASELLKTKAHLQVCDLCSNEVEDLKAFRSSIPRVAKTETENIIPLQRKVSRWMWVSAVAAAIAIATTTGLVWYQNRIEGLQGQLKKVESQNAKLQHDIEQAGINEQSIIFKDGATEIRIRKDGQVIAALSIPQEQQEAIRNAVEHQKLNIPPDVSSMIGKSEVLMGNSEELPFRLLTPVATAVATARPVFRWESLESASTYQVRIFDSEFHSILQSPWVAQTEWTPTNSLPLSTTFIWQVAAKKQNEEVISPLAPFPDAKFRILSSDEIAKLQELQNKYSGFHLIVGVQYAQLGLLDDAEYEFGALQQSNPNSKEAFELLRSVKQLRSLK